MDDWRREVEGDYDWWDDPDPNDDPGLFDADELSRLLRDNDSGYGVGDDDEDDEA